jgi:hypothetical protein
VWLDLHWSDQGQWGANNGQHQMPDDHSTLFWQDVATRYRDNPAVLFGLYNEPHVDNMSYAGAWSLWRNGGSITEGGTNYHTPGMQGLLNTVRATGATNVVLAGGNGWASDLSGVTNGYALSDSAANLGYDIHLYPAAGRDDVARDNRVSAVAAGHLVVVGEWGTTPQGDPNIGYPYPNASVWVRGMLAWLDRRHYSWTAWDLHPFSGPQLISDWNYTPTVPFGQDVYHSGCRRRLPPPDRRQPFRGPQRLVGPAGQHPELYHGLPVLGGPQQQRRRRLHLHRAE